MFFPESEAIASEHPDLLHAVSEVDARLSTVSTPGPLRAGDFACAIGGDQNQVASAFDLLAHKGVLSRAEMVECEQCHNLMAVYAFRQAVQDEDDFECSTCGRHFHRRSEPIVVYRMTDSALARPRPIETTRKSLTFGNEPLGERAECVLVAMLELGAIDVDNRKTTEKIAVAALGDEADANSLKGVMSDLSTRQLTDSRTGRGGGCWLTEKGQSRAQKLRDEY